MEIASAEDDRLGTQGIYLISDCISVYMSEYDMSCVSIDTVYRVAKDLYVVFNGDTGYQYGRMINQCSAGEPQNLLICIFMLSI